ncbi:o-succinylbenzoate synthase [Arcanobacterium hippocoleae]
MGKTIFQPSVFTRLAAEQGEIQAFIYELEMRVQFRGITVRNGVLLHGPAGWAEFSPFWGYSTKYSARWLLGALDTAINGPVNVQRSEIAVNVTVPAVGAAEAAQIALGLGADTAKVKVAEIGQDPKDDLNRLAAVRDALGKNAKIRIDVNGRWDLQTALELLPQYHRAAGGLEYAEQPCMEVVDLAAIRRRYPQIKIAADESIRRAEDPFRVRAQEAADLIIVKNQPLGGVRAVLELLQEIEMPAAVSSALESSLGLASGLHLAGALPNLRYACGLGTAKLFPVTSPRIR